MSLQTPQQLAQTVALLAAEAGFARMGIAPLAPSPHDATFESWLAEGNHADMAWLERHLPLRRTVAAVAPWARSAICLAVSYAPAGPGDSHVARYARGRDYHRVLRQRCRRLMAAIAAIAPDFEGKAFVDACPLSERRLAASAGLGWIGLNGCLIVPGLGSYVVLCEILCNLPLPPGEPLAGHCGRCGACVKACPARAIGEQGRVDCRRCLSYHTVENRGQIATSHRAALGQRVLGCDACQEACPHNRGAGAGDGELATAGAIAAASLEDLLQLTYDDWDRVTRGSAARRASCEMLVRNAIIAAANSGRRELVAHVRAAGRAWPGQAALVKWALEALEIEI
ncbi:MAG: tRNA epoxyqueuosine(34) reductase QueG [Planctomycetaceae bacterium]|nr:tRNA epoxyqueuosine(34) reductase QueG [Planctomycetaceae bacterium]